MTVKWLYVNKISLRERNRLSTVRESVSSGSIVIVLVFWFAVLSTSSVPFQCYACCHVKELADLSDIVSTLKKEVSVLRNDITV